MKGLRITSLYRGYYLGVLKKCSLIIQIQMIDCFALTRIVNDSDVDERGNIKDT